MVDSIRYWLGAALVATLPAAVLYWYLIHPFAERWRRLGRTRTYWIVGSICLALAVGAFMLRDALLGADLGFRPLFAAIGLALYAVAAYIEYQCKKQLKFHILTGAPELSEDQPGKLLQEGIYGRIRHPRYVDIVIGIGGFALFINYFGFYLVYAATIPALFGIVLLEERELRSRFGEAYEDYSRRVPRFVPRFGSG